MTFILVWNDRCEVFTVTDEATARYWFERRIEKGGATATQAFLFPADKYEMPVGQWESAYDERVRKAEKAYAEEQEHREFERLKKKFEGGK